jgi:hypothetical protein
MSDTQGTTPESGNAELTVGGAANAILGLMGSDEGSQEEQPEAQAEANDSEAESDAEESYEDSDESEVEQDDGNDEQEEPPKYRVKAAGEEREVTLDELIKSYQLGTDYTKKSQAVAEERKAIEAERQRIEEARSLRDQYAERLQVIEQMLNQQPQTEDLDYLKENDPIGYAVKVAELSQRDKQLAQVQAERQRIAEQQQRERQEELGKVVQAEARKLAEAIPEYADPQKGEAVRQQLREFGLKAGFSDNELANVYDSRAVLTLWKAMQYDKLQSAKPGITKKVSEAPKVMKSGVSQPRDSGNEELRKLKARAKQSGRVADAARAFEKFL